MLGRQIRELVQRHAITNGAVTDVTAVPAYGSDRRVFQQTSRWRCFDCRHEPPLSQVLGRLVACVCIHISFNFAFQLELEISNSNYSGQFSKG